MPRGEKTEEDVNSLKIIVLALSRQIPPPDSLFHEDPISGCCSHSLELPPRVRRPPRFRVPLAEES